MFYLQKDVDQDGTYFTVTLQNYRWSNKVSRFEFKKWGYFIYRYIQ